MIDVPNTILQQAMILNSDLEAYLSSLDVDIDSRHGYSFAVETNPIKYSKIFLHLLEDELSKKFPNYRDYFKMEYLNIKRANKRGEKLRGLNDWDYSCGKKFTNLMELKEGLHVLDKMTKNKATSLPKLAMKLHHIFTEKLGERCWLYKYDDEVGKHLPILIRQVEYKPKERYREYSSVNIEYAYNSQNITVKNTFEIDTDMFKEHGRDVYSVLEGAGFRFEDEELLAEYKNLLSDYLDKATWQNKQMVYKGEKYINDNLDGDKGRRANTKKMNERLSSYFSLSGDLLEVPYDFTIYAFNLGSHSFEWIKTPASEKYLYNKKIGEKLILPEEHKNLIDILLSDDIRAISGDFIEGKGNGTIILAKGVAGIGKTATAEVYSETKELPLYSVHSGQLSIKGESVEAKLKVIFERAERWGCCTLIDEADVFIRKRDNDVNHNAIVASFLRTMEYFSGILFMTSNREDDVDEAIESRCIAVLKYGLPTEEIRKSLWELFIGEFKLNVDDGLTSVLAKEMDGLSGRDIKNITKLSSRYAIGMKMEKVDLEVFKLCATYRGKYTIK